LAAVYVTVTSRKCQCVERCSFHTSADNGVIQSNQLYSPQPPSPSVQRC